MTLQSFKNFSVICVKFWFVNEQVYRKIWIRTNFSLVCANFELWLIKKGITWKTSPLYASLFCRYSTPLLSSTLLHTHIQLLEDVPPINGDPSVGIWNEKRNNDRNGTNIIFQNTLVRVSTLVLVDLIFCHCWFTFITKGLLIR